MPFRHRHLLFCALPQLHESRSEAKELLSGWGECRATFVSDEKGSSKLLLKEANTCANCRLSDMQTISRFDEASCRDDLYESSGELDVHLSSSIIHADKCQLDSFVCSES